MRGFTGCVMVTSLVSLSLYGCSKQEKKFTFQKRAGKIPESTPWAKVRDSFDTAMLRQVMAEEDRFALQRFDYRGSEKSDGAK